MKIICTTSIPFAQEVFAPLGELTILEPRQVSPAALRNADILICRSTLKVNKSLLEGSKVQFVGTCTIGYDHFDTEYLDKKGITWTAAPGCNANSVAEYVTAALLCLAKRHHFQLRDKTIAVIGVGNVGSRVVKKSEALGMRVLLNDPPLHDAMVGRDSLVPPKVSGRTGSPALPIGNHIHRIYLPLEEVLAKADILTLHVPLTKEGKYPTWHMAGGDFFKKLKSGCIFINSARGAVMDSEAFLKARAAGGTPCEAEKNILSCHNSLGATDDFLRQEPQDFLAKKGKIALAVIDCWESEPAFRLDVMKGADVATAHIAGYSFEGLSMGTVQVYRKLCAFLGVKPQITLEELLPPPPVPEISFDAGGMGNEEALVEVIRQVYNIEADDADLRRVACEDAKARGRNLEKIRQNYHMRREFRFTKVILRNASSTLANTLRKLEFQVVAE
jgi:erythronate-4-phosphate dehydrogenase